MTFCVYLSVIPGKNNTFFKISSWNIVSKSPLYFRVFMEGSNISIKDLLETLRDGQKRKRYLKSAHPNYPKTDIVILESKKKLLFVGQCNYNNNYY